MNNQDFEQEWFIPSPVMQNREKLFLNLLTVGELLQWGIFGIGMYLFSTYMPLVFSIKLGVVTSLFLLGITFIHTPINGLTGKEWLEVYFKYRREGRQGFHTTSPVSVGPNLGLARVDVDIDLTRHGAIWQLEHSVASGEGKINQW